MATKIVKMDEPKEEKTTTVTSSHRWSIEHFDVYARGQCLWKTLVADTFTLMKDEIIKFSPIIEVIEKRQKKWLAVAVSINRELSWWTTEAEWRDVWSIEDAEGRRVKRQGHGWKRQFDTSELMWNSYIAIADLLAPDLKLLIDGKLVLQIEVTLRSVKPLFPLSIISPPSSSFTNTTTPMIILSHRFSLSNFSLLFQQDDYCPLYFESDYFAPEAELVGQFKMKVYFKELCTDIAQRMVISIINENTAYSGTAYTRLTLLRKDRPSITVVDGVAKFVPGCIHHCPVSRQVLLNPANDLLPEDTLTMDCLLMVQVEEETTRRNMLRYNSTSTINVAQYQIHRAQIVWSIEQFREKYYKGTERLESDSFEPSTAPAGYSFRMHLYAQSESDGKDLMVALDSELQPNEEIEVQYRFGITHKEKQAWVTMPDRTAIFKTNQMVNHPLIARNILFAHSDRLLPNDKLTLYCQIWIIEKRNHNTSRLPAEDINLQASTSANLKSIELVDSTTSPPTSWETMLTLLTTSNAAEYFYLAHQHQLPEKFKKKVVKLMRDNRQAVISSEGWTRYIEANPFLFRELFKLF